VDRQPGDVFWGDPVTHSVENLGTAGIHQPNRRAEEVRPAVGAARPSNKGMKLTNLSEAPGVTEAPLRAFRRFTAVRTGSQLIPGVRRTTEVAMASARRKVAGLVLAGATAVCFGASGAHDEPASVSIVQLLATPERYEGRLVRVKGVAHFEFEESALYLHREDAECMNSSNGLWLRTGGHDDLSNAFVIVEGRFTARSHGHLGAWPGEIKNISRLERAGTRKDYANVPPPPRPAQ